MGSEKRFSSQQRYRCSLRFMENIHFSLPLETTVHTTITLMTRGEETECALGHQSPTGGMVLIHDHKPRKNTDLFICLTQRIEYTSIEYCIVLYSDHTLRCLFNKHNMFEQYWLFQSGASIDLIFDRNNNLRLGIKYH